MLFWKKFNQKNPKIRENPRSVSQKILKFSTGTNFRRNVASWPTVGGSFPIVDSTTFLQLFYILQPKIGRFSTSTKHFKILHLQHKTEKSTTEKYWYFSIYSINFSYFLLLYAFYYPRGHAEIKQERMVQNPRPVSQRLWMR